MRSIIRRIIWTLFSVLKVFRKRSTSGKVVIVRTDGIGDLVLFSGTLRYIRARFDGRIEMIVRSYCTDLLRESPHVDRIIPWDSTRNLTFRGIPYQVQFLIRLWKETPDVVLYPMWTRTMVADDMVRAMNPRMTYLFDTGRGLEHLNGDVISVQPPENAIHETDRYPEFLASIGANHSHTLSPELHYSAGDADEIRTILGGRTDSFFTIAPGSQSHIKQWQSEKWIETVKVLLNHSSLDCIVVGGREDRDTTNALSKGLEGKRVVDLTGKLTLPQVTALLEKSRFCIGVDSGMAHIAAAQGTRVFSIMGGGQFGRFFPHGTSAEVTIIHVPMECFGCDWHCIYDRPVCIHDIEVDHVVQPVLKYLETGAENEKWLTTP